MGFRKPEQRKQGLKILGYGEDNSGKSLFALTFPQLAFIDTESKIGVYENDPKYNKNLLAIADTVNYYEVIDLMNSVIKNPKQYKTFITDSETNLYDSMQVSAMEVEEEKAKKYKKNIDDAIVAQRGWGKVKLNNARLKNTKAQMSALGITLISIAHKKDVTEEQNGKTVKVGEKPELKEGSKHDYDIILRFFKTTEGKKKRFWAEVEKDTTNTYSTGTILENVSYDNWKSYIENNQTFKTIETSYNKAIETNIEDMKNDELDVDVKKILTQINEIAVELAETNKKEVIDIIKEYHKKSDGTGNANYNSITDIDVANKVLDALNEFKNKTNTKSNQEGNINE